MFHFKSSTRFILLASFVAMIALSASAQSPAGKTARSKRANSSSHREQYTAVGVSFLSWNESVELKSVAASDKAAANFFGNTIHAEKSFLFSSNFGYLLYGGAMLGYAHVGGTQGAVPYRLANRSWWGALASIRASYQPSTDLIGSIGPVAIYRNIDLPTSSAISSVQGAPTFNYGLSADVRFAVHPHWLVRAEMGSFFTQASTMWMLGLSYIL